MPKKTLPEKQLETNAVNSPVHKKTFFKHFWWLWIIIFIVLIIIGIIAYSENRYNRGLTGNGRGFLNFGNMEKEFNERVVKTFTPESGTAFKYASPMLYNEHLYVGTSERIGYDNAPISQMHDNFFYKFDLDLNVKWQYPLGKKMVGGGAVMDSNNNLYFVTESLNDKNDANKKEQIFSTTYITSLTEDGQFRWEKQISAEGEYWDHSSITPAISLDDIIYIGNNRFYAFDTEGNILATYPSQDNQTITNYSGAPVIDNVGNVYFTSPEPINVTSTNSKEELRTEVIRAYKFTSRLTFIVWSTVMGNEILDNEGGNPNGGGGQKASGIESPPALGIDGRSLFGLVGCTISKIDTITGQLLWSIKPDGATGHFNASPAIDDQDDLYVGTKSNMESRFYAISSAGKLLWRTDIGSDLYNSPILGDDNKIYVGSETVKDGKFHVIDRQTGEQVWAIGKDNERKIPDFTHDGMLLYKGYVYVGVHSAGEGNEEGVLDPTLYKIKVDAYDYLTDASWPRIYGGNANTGRLY